MKAFLSLFLFSLADRQMDIIIFRLGLQTSSGKKILNHESQLFRLLNIGQFIFLYKYIFFFTFLGNTILALQLKKEMSDTKQLSRGFVCGCVAGFMQVFVMQPFEIIKVRLVNQSLLKPEYFGISHCFRRILKEEGVTAFYRGTVSPLIGYGLQGSLAFGSNELFKALITYFDKKKDQRQNAIMPMSQVFLSGILTGVVSTAVLTPSDHIRILLQKHSKTQKYRGSIDAGIDVFRQYKIKGLYLGFTPTLIREVLANAVYFYTYEYVMRLFAGGKSSSEANILAAFIAGGLAGSNSWLLTYPVDYIKTVMQSQDLKQLKYRSTLQCTIEQYLIEGYRAFFKGLGITMLRSFPVNGVAFLSFEYVMRLMKGIN